MGPVSTIILAMLVVIVIVVAWSTYVGGSCTKNTQCPSGYTCSGGTGGGKCVPAGSFAGRGPDAFTVPPRPRRRGRRGRRGRSWLGGYGRRGWGRPQQNIVYHVPYAADSSNARPCYSDPTDGRDLCQGVGNHWGIDDRCHVRDSSGRVAEYVWRSGPEGERCYSYNR
jgi:hypothetical protein